ncbi:MAG: LCP family protein, partial [Burkholderiales bacterium]|nr:LCP family protein [Anaerolineae bacterium]
VGVDARPGEGMVTRTDSIMLIGVNPQRMQVSLLSIPRDLFIDVPVYGMERINTVNALGEQEQADYGVTLLSQAIGQNFGVGIDRYARLDFNGFVAVIDAVGGVDIEVPGVIEDYAYPTANFDTIAVRFEAGWQHMDGERALIYARTRHGDDDYQRAARQQQVISALASKLIIPVYWPGAAAAIGRSVETNLSPIDMLLIAPPVLFSGGNFEQLVIDRSTIITTGDGVAVPNYELVNPWLAERFD